MRRKPAPRRAASSGCKDGAGRCRWWPARPATTTPRTPVCPGAPGHAGRRSRTPHPARTRRSAGKCTAGRAPDARRTGRNRHTPATPSRPQIPGDSRVVPSSAAHERVRRVDLLGHILERGVADILAMHHVNHVLAYVFGMIADPLQRTHDPHDLERAPDGARVFHHEGDALTLNRLVLFIHHLILFTGLQGSLRRSEENP